MTQIILKWAQTSDGFIAHEDFSSRWISSESSRELVHQWRTEVDAIVVGSNTVRYDDPLLTARTLPPPQKQPIRIVFDRTLALPPTHRVFDSSSPTLVLNELREERRDNVRFKRITFSMEAVLRAFSEEGLGAVMVEGGARTWQWFIDGDAWNEARVFVAPTKFGSGIIAPRLPIGPVREEGCDVDLLRIYFNER